MKTEALLLIALLGLSSLLHAQIGTHLVDKNYFYPTAEENYSQNVPGVALSSLMEVIEVDNTIGLESKSSFALDETRSIDLLLESVARATDDVERNIISLEIANKYFERKDYQNAKRFYGQIHHSFLSDIDGHQVNFNLGYIHLLDKDFTVSSQYFDKAALSIGPNTKDAQYYLGVNQYYLNEIDDAVNNFEKVESHPRYGKLIPYYLSQIYFKAEKYDEVIAYGESRLQSPQLKNKSQIHKMLGLSYLASGENNKALQHLDEYASVTPKLTENEFFQLGLLHYKVGNQEKAAEHLRELSHQSTETGQMANYLLGAIALNSGDKKDASSAFKQASKMEFFEDIQSESTFLYYKLSADLGEERTAIAGLVDIPQSDQHYNDSQRLLSELLVRSSDHTIALSTIEKLPAKSPEILATYQQLSYEYGLQLVESNDNSEALPYFKAASETPGNTNTKAQAQFWTGYLYDLDGDKARSGAELNKYLESGDKEYAFESHYLLSYQNIENQDFQAAKNSLESAILKFQNDDDKSLFDDALTRVADLELVDNNYDSALEYYDLAIENEATDADYIMLQKALIYGVNGQPYDKLTTLETLVKEYKESEYRDDALFEVGETLVQLNKNNEAYKIYDSLTDLYGQSEYAPKSWMRKGLISYNQGDMEKALVAYEQGLKTTKNNEDQRAALIAIEEIYLENLGDSDAYFRFLESEIGYQYEDIEKDSITYEVAYTAYKSGEYEQAIKLFSSYVRRFDGGFYVDDAAYYQGESHALLKQYDEALVFYEEVMEKPDSEHYRSSLKKGALIAYNHSQDFSKSYTYYDKYITLESSNGLELHEAALYSAFISANQQGVVKYGPVVTKYKDATDQSRGVAHYYLGKTFQSLNQVEDAIDAYTQVGRYLTNNEAAESSYNLSKIFFDRGDYAAAEVQAFETTKKATNYPFWVAKSLILIGDVYGIKKDYLNASAAYESVIENFQDDPKVNQEAKDKLAELNVIIEKESRIRPEDELDFIEIDSLEND